MNRGATGCLDRLAVVTCKVETIGWVFNAHRDPDAGSFFHEFVCRRLFSNHRIGNWRSAIIITYVASEAVLDLHSNEFL